MKMCRVLKIVDAISNYLVEQGFIESSERISKEERNDTR